MAPHWEEVRVVEQWRGEAMAEVRVCEEHPLLAHAQGLGSQMSWCLMG